MSTLRDELRDLAAAAPLPPDPGTGGELWRRGVRRRRRAAAVRIGAVVAAVLVVVSLGTMPLGQQAPEPPPTDVPFADLHLPRTVHRPPPWAPGTDERGEPGPLAVLGMAPRKRATGLRGVDDTVAPYGVSAVDGSVVFLDLADTEPDRLGSGSLVLSPDGTKVGYLRYRPAADLDVDPGAAVARGADGEPDPAARVVVGFGIYDTTTGRSLLLDDPDNPVIAGMDASELTFSGDSRHLQTSYSLSGSTEPRQHSLVVWDARTGEPVVAEEAGAYWLPNMGAAPSGIVWSRGSRTYTFDPTTGRTSSLSSGFEVVQASWGPGEPGARPFAAIAFGEPDQADWRLLAGLSPDTVREVASAIDPGELLGWRDPQHVVVRDLSHARVVEVDLRTGEEAPIEIDVDVDGDQTFHVLYAGDLWANPLVEGVEPPEAGDPRRPWQVASLGVALLLMVPAARLLWRRRDAR